MSHQICQEGGTQQPIMGVFVATDVTLCIHPSEANCGLSMGPPCRLPPVQHPTAKSVAVPRRSTCRYKQAGPAERPLLSLPQSRLALSTLALRVWLAISTEL
jgi:hypothetical protein